MFARFNRKRKHDRRPDRQTNTAREHRPRLCIASRGNRIKLFCYRFQFSFVAVVRMPLESDMLFLCPTYRYFAISKWMMLCHSWMQDGFYRVDHDYVVNSARLAKDGGCSQFHVISSRGANKDSSMLYMKTKVWCLFIPLLLLITIHYKDISRRCWSALMSRQAVRHVRI